MVAANKEARFVRELDLFRNKLGIRATAGSFSIAAQNELQVSASKFRVERERDRGHDCDGR